MTSTDVSNKQENVEQFLRITKELLKAKQYVSLTTGESVSLDLTSKSVYSWMKDRWAFFTKGSGQYYDSQSDVADALGIHRNTVSKIIAKFLEHGIFVVEKRKNGRFESSVYVQIHTLTFCIESPAPKKAPESVSNATLYPCQGLEEFVESKVLVEAYSEPVEPITEQIAPEDEVYDEDISDLWPDEMKNDKPSVVRDAFIQTPDRVFRMEQYTDRHEYGQDYFSDYPASPYNNHGQVSDSFKAWLSSIGGELDCDTYFEFNGDMFRIPRYYV